MKSDAERLDDVRIMRLFRGRCVGNIGHTASVVHELVTRGRTKKAITMPRNRVPLCNHCHDITHSGGYTIEKESMLRIKAERMLEGFGIDLNTW